MLVKVDALHSYTVHAFALAWRIILSNMVEHCKHWLYGNGASSRTVFCTLPGRHRTVFGDIDVLCVALALRTQVPGLA